MAKIKQNPKDDLSASFETAKSSVLAANPNLKKRILIDADKMRLGLDLAENQPWIGSILIGVKNLRGVSAMVGFTVPLAAGICIGFYSADWSELIANVSLIYAFDEVNLIGSFFGMI